MIEEIRHEPKCYYVSPEYYNSFWGRYIYIYEGSGSLTLTNASLSFQSRSMNFDIPLEAILGFKLAEFSRAAKPLGLLSLVLRYEIGGKEFTTHLIPCHSNFDPTWETSKRVAGWVDSLLSVDILADRLDAPLLQIPEGPRPKSLKKALGLGVVLTIAVASFIFLLLR